VKATLAQQSIQLLLDELRDERPDAGTQLLPQFHASALPVPDILSGTPSARATGRTAPLVERLAPAARLASASPPAPPRHALTAGSSQQQRATFTIMRLARRMKLARGRPLGASLPSHGRAEVA